MASLSLKKIYKKYDNGFCAVTDFNLEVADKEFVVFVGPSGCGKSTTHSIVDSYPWVPVYQLLKIKKLVLVG